MPQVKLSIIYYSSTGTLHALAVEAANAAEKAGAEVRLRRVPELAPDEVVATNKQWADHAAATATIPVASHADLTWADAIMLGAPTRFGLPAAQLKQFLDTTGPLWAEGKLVDKLASSFTATATAHGGQESTILAINNTFYHWGAVIVPPGYADPIQFASGNPYGASHVSNNASLPPGDVELSSVAFQARRLTEAALRWKRGDQTDKFRALPRN